MEPILYPVQIVTGGGRAKGFTVAEYLQWSTLPTLRQTEVWNSLLCLYNRLGAAYDHFYQVLGFLSPEIRKLLETQKPYADAYRTNSFQDYAKVYAPTESPIDIVEPYCEVDYPETYSHLLMNQVLGGIRVE